MFDEATQDLFVRGPRNLKDYVRFCEALDELRRPTPQPELSPEHKLGPACWDDYIGQADMKMRLRVHIVSAKNRGARLDHVLLTGIAGSGKTTLAGLIAAELGVDIAVVTKPVEAPQLHRILSNLGTGCLFLDEVHGWSRRQQHALMQLTEEQALDGPTGPVSYPNITVIAATTEPNELFAPLLTRFPIRPDIAAYTDEDMAGIVTGMAARAGVHLDDDTAAMLGRASAGRPRAARDLVLAARDLACADMNPDGPAVLAFTGIDPDGVTAGHRDYLAALAACDGTAGMTVLESRLRLPAAAIRDLEWLLIERDYIAQTKQGRALTAKGRARLRIQQEAA